MTEHKKRMQNEYSLSYDKGLNLEKEPNFPKIDQILLKKWKEKNVFGKLQQRNKKGKPYPFFDGPITANNPMAVHHVWGRTLKDVYQRYQSMLGKKLRYQNGFDCQGLWVEVEVEKELKLNSKTEILEYGLEHFSNTCKNRVNRFADVITTQSIRLGQWMDWDNSYFTYSDKNIEYIWYFLQKCHENGWIYQGTKILPWCPRCSTSLSTHEQGDSYRNLRHNCVYLKMPLLEERNTSFLVWTTTPWTLLANVALAVNPDLNYVVIEEEQERYILAEETMKLLKCSSPIVKKLKGSELVGKTYAGPFEELSAQKIVKKRVVVGWNEVNSTEGTGIVHIAPGCGEEDYELGKKENLSVISPIDEEGKFLERFDEFYGLTTKEVYNLIEEKLKQKNLLYKVELYQHRYPVCWRCDEELVFKLEKEWFIQCDEIRPRMMEAAKKVTWKPDYIGKAMQNWLLNMGDWNIGRKRYWGLPLPFYPCSCGELTVIGSKKELTNLAVKQESNLTLPELHRPWIDEITIRCPTCGNEVERVKEVGDCWLDAGIIPFSTLDFLEENGGYDNWKEWFPAEVVVEMKEQVRLWFYSMLFMGVTLVDKPPFKTVVTYDEVRNKEGKRMSKSGPNAVVFDEVIEKTGADVLRWLFCSYPISQQLHFDYNLAKEAKKQLLVLWNIAYFFSTSAETDGFSLEELDDFKKLEKHNIMDQWILDHLNETVKNAKYCYENYDLEKLIQLLLKFIENVSNWYVRLNRRRFWKSELDKDKKEGYGTLLEVLQTLNKIMAPVVPFMTDHIYHKITPAEETRKKPSVHLQRFPNRVKTSVNKNLLDNFEVVQRIISMGMQLRNNSKVRVRQPLQKVTVWVEREAEREALTQFEPQIKKEMNVYEMKITTTLLDNFELRAKLNFSKVGPKFTNILQEIKSSIDKLDQNTLRKLKMCPEKIFLEISGNSVELEVEDYTIVNSNRTGGSSLIDDNYAVFLDLAISPKLESEGYARDIVRQIQNMRKELNLNLTDEIEVTIRIELNKKVKEEFLNRLNYIKEETLATYLTLDEDLHQKELEINTNLCGNETRIQIRRKKRSKGVSFTHF